MLYNFGIYIYGILLRLGAIFHPKARKWVSGRKNFWKTLPKMEKENVIWFHCASLGEYDQGKPIMEAWKKKYPKDFILVTFFSPSGYENCKDKSVGDYTCYLPLDTPRNAQRFIQYFQPKKAFFIKYEIWINFLMAAKNKDCQLYSISANFRERQIYFKNYGRTFRKALLLFDQIFVQYANSKSLLSSIGINNVTISGDTRYDRVVQRTKDISENTIIAPWTKGETIFVVGSSWPKGEDILLPLINKGKIKEKTILAPHEVHKSHILAIQKKLNVPFQLYTRLQDGEKLKKETKVLILDCIGILPYAYKYGSIAYVGGGFGTGLHNILEPAAFGLPVIFGPKYPKFPEADAFIQAKIAKSCTDSLSFFSAYSSYRKADTISLNVKQFIEKNRGATTIVMHYFD